MRLNVVPFAHLHSQQRNTEFDIIAIVVKYGPVKYAGANSNKCREIIVMDTGTMSLPVCSFYCTMRPTILTLWEDFGDTDGNILATQAVDYPVIVAKQITRTNYAGMEKLTLFSYYKESVMNSLLK